jgi:hypothetical protein
MRGGKTIGLELLSVFVYLVILIPVRAGAMESKCALDLTPKASAQEVIDAIKCIDDRLAKSMGGILVSELSGENVVEDKSKKNIIGEWQLDSNGHKGNLLFFKTVDGIKGQVRFNSIRVWEPIAKVNVTDSAISFHRPRTGSDYTGYLVNGILRGSFIEKKKEYSWLASTPESE